jgi:hypothetical protein
MDDEALFGPGSDTVGAEETEEEPPSPAPAPSLAPSPPPAMRAVLGSNFVAAEEEPELDLDSGLEPEPKMADFGFDSDEVISMPSSDNEQVGSVLSDDEFETSVTPGGFGFDAKGGSSSDDEW